MHPDAEGPLILAHKCMRIHGNQGKSMEINANLIWDDHLEHLGYQSRSYKVQDAISKRIISDFDSFAGPLFQKNLKHNEN